ncbi:hypothetical protein OTU49_011532 [Cherax quadricarinatus]|uniref:Fibronectin type-III domain-containing protein n=1 Tax=Cherax quadricarinatus TaxID=27406 RepID=A0AAW0W2W7_CHEQU|nr:activating transcription factor 7-interacting protein 1-like isoform X2 [Cherax quadricarinatus]
MKAMEPGAPMISVPAGVLKEFMSPTNSRTPTPPPAPTVSVSNIIKSLTPTSTSNNNSRTSSPFLPTSIDLSAVTVNSVSSVPTSEATTPISPSLTNGQLPNDSDNCENEERSKSPEICARVDASGNHSLSEPVVNGISSGVKRTSEEEGGARKPDLKKIRVFANSVDNGLKRDLSMTVKDFNQHLDQVSKKLGDADGQENKDDVTLNEIRNGNNNVVTGNGNSGISSGDGNSDAVTSVNPVAKSIVNSGQTKDVHVLPPATKLREVLISISKEKELRNAYNKERMVAIPVVDKENKQIIRRLQRLPRRELENMILRQFSEKTLYQCELGRMKQLCEKLETTLESNRKKTAQFHKEIEDLRKVTNRLSTEHASRKGQYVAPIRIKRSVGIQAAPHIINKGIMHANGSGGMIKTIAPRPSSLAGVSSPSYPVKPFYLVGSQGGSPPNVTFHTKMIPPTSTSQNLVAQSVGIFTPPQSGVGRQQTITNIASAASLAAVATSTSGLSTVRPTAGQMLMMTPTGAMQALPRASNAGVVSSATSVLPVAQGRVVRAPIGGLTSVVPSTGTLLSTQRPVLLQNDKAITGTTSVLQTPLSSRGSGVIDLTDEDEGNRRPAGIVPKPGTLVKVPTSGTAQLLPLQAGGVGQVVLLPQMSGGQPTAALIVSQVSTGMTTLDSMTNPTVAQARIGSLGSHTTNNSRVMGSVVNTAPRTTTSTLPQVTQMRHPAPLPRTPFQQVGGLSKKLPPQPTLKLSHKDSSIVLSWTMSKTEDHEAIASYQLYAYQEGAAPPSANLWKKVGSVKALELPMACTLTQFMPGHVYHFAVRAVDIKSRLGPFSEPRSISLDKK